MMNEDDYKDMSIWHGFFTEETVFASIAVLKAMQKDIEDELLERELWTEKKDANIDKKENDNAS